MGFKKVPVHVHSPADDIATLRANLDTLRGELEQVTEESSVRIADLEDENRLLRAPMRLEQLPSPQLMQLSIIDFRHKEEEWNRDRGALGARLTEAEAHAARLQHRLDSSVAECARLRREHAKQAASIEARVVRAQETAAEARDRSAKAELAAQGIVSTFRSAAQDRDALVEMVESNDHGHTEAMRRCEEELAAVREDNARARAALLRSRDANAKMFDVIRDLSGRLRAATGDDAAGHARQIRAHKTAGRRRETGNNGGMGNKRSTGATSGAGDQHRRNRTSTSTSTGTSTSTDDGGSADGGDSKNDDNNGKNDDDNNGKDGGRNDVDDDDDERGTIGGSDSDSDSGSGGFFGQRRGSRVTAGACAGAGAGAGAGTGAAPRRSMATGSRAMMPREPADAHHLARIATLVNEKRALRESTKFMSGRIQQLKDQVAFKDALVSKLRGQLKSAAGAGDAAPPASSLPTPPPPPPSQHQSSHASSPSRPRQPQPPTAVTHLPAVTTK
jgi:hypothetical protein